MYPPLSSKAESGCIFQISERRNHLCHEEASGINGIHCPCASHTTSSCPEYRSFNRLLQKLCEKLFIGFIYLYLDFSIALSDCDCLDTFPKFWHWFLPRKRKGPLGPEGLMLGSGDTGERFDLE